MTEGAGAPSSPQQAFHRDRWVIVTAGGATLVTTTEALLLQRRYGFFTGGFLSRNHLDGVTEILTFLATSLLVDAAVIGLGAATVLATCTAVGFRRSGPYLAFIVPVGVLVGADFVQYRLLDYLGGAFDLGLMFDLAGRNLSELLAVSAEYLVVPVAFLFGVTGVIGAAAWWFERQGATSSNATSAVGRIDLRRAAALVAVVVVASTGARLYSESLEQGLRRKPAGRLIGTLVRAITDVDRDGFGLLTRPADPDPWNSEIFPYAVDRPGNGVDENGVGGDLPLDALHTGTRFDRRPSFVTRPNVVLVVLESFRSDLIGATHAGRAVTPTLDALKRQGVSTTRAYSHNGYTVQSRYHLMSGALVPGLTDTTLVDDFRANGYEVAYFSGQDESFGGSGLGVGFDRADVSYDARNDRERRYSTFSTAGSLAVSHALVRERVREFLEQRDDGRPLFLYVNFHDTHFPYHHREIEPLLDATVLPRGDITPARGPDLVAMYRNTAANVDRTIGRVLADVRDAVGADPVVLVTADHGESLFDENFLGHGYALNDAQTAIPLIAVNLPVELDEPFGQIQLRGTLWRALEAQRPADDAASPRTGDQRSVFQYLGRLSRPRQIASVGASHRTIYDFRTGLARIADGPWQRLDHLVADDERVVMKLIHRWEALLFAGSQSPGASGINW